MEKKCYYSLSDEDNVTGLILSPSALADYLLGDYEMFSNGEIDKYILTPVFMTETEYKNLPEYQF